MLQVFFLVLWGAGSPHCHWRCEERRWRCFGYPFGYMASKVLDSKLSLRYRGGNQFIYSGKCKCWISSSDVECAHKRTRTLIKITTQRHVWMGQNELLLALVAPIVICNWLGVNFLWTSSCSINFFLNFEIVKYVSQNRERSFSYF